MTSHHASTVIFQLLSKSLMPPHELHLSGVWGLPLSPISEDPILTVGRLTQTFFSQTLTVLHITKLCSVPLTLLLICPGLREILLDRVEASEEGYDKYPDGQCSGRELPTLDSLDCCGSESFVKQMITPPSRFNTGVALWSKLRVLRLCPHEEEEMAYLQPILDLACNTLEELHLTKTRIGRGKIYEQLPLAGLVDLRDLSCLRVFALCIIFEGYASKPAVLTDINLVLRTIPTSNKVTSLTFYFIFSNQYASHGSLEEDWVGLCDEVVRISGGKHLKLNLDVSMFWRLYLYVTPGKINPPLGEGELREYIMERIAPLSKYVLYPRPLALGNGCDFSLQLCP